MSSLYFNNAFSKQPLPDVVAAMQPYLRDEFENPLTESDGAERIRSMIQKARESVAACIHAKPGEIYFVSSGTEANNWALKGAAWNRGKNHLVISAVEHFSVYQTAEFLRRQGFDLTIIPVDSSGFVDPADLARAVRSSTFLVSVQSASDEIGVIQNAQEIAAIKRRFPDVLFHTDGIQFVCYETLDLRQLPFDLVSLSSNALYGPPGIAALYIREGTRIQPLMHGGMQEEGMRPGYQAPFLVAGFGKAAEISLFRKSRWKERLLDLRQTLYLLFDRLGVPVIGSRQQRLADNILAIADVDGEAILTLLLERGVRASSGSTCTQYAQKESHVLKALGITPESARGAILFTLGVDQTENEISLLCFTFEEALTHLRRLKP